MKRIAIIGSGISGLLAAHGLAKAGHTVTLYSDRTGDQWMNDSRPTGTAARFESSLAFDRELGVAFWDESAPPVEGISLVFCPKPGNRLVSLTARLKRPGIAIDVRWMSAKWMKELEQRGARVVIESVTVPRVDEISGENDLTVIAAGSKSLCSLFARNAERSVHDKPQRNLCMLIVRGAELAFKHCPFLPVRFNLMAEVGEAFWVPYLHKDGEQMWCLLFEAKPGGRMDRFNDVKSGAEGLRIGKEVIADLFPWDSQWAANMTLADEHGWLVGGIAPTIREPVARMPSGRVVTGLGDTLMALDPIAGQGANNGTKMTRHFVDAVARATGNLDEAWMRQTFESYWEEQGRHIVRFNNALLEPISPAGRVVLVSQYGSDGVSTNVRQRLANGFCANFNDPRLCTDVLLDDAIAKRFVVEHGGSYPWTMLSGGMGVARAQVRQMLGMEPGHPAHG